MPTPAARTPRQNLQDVLMDVHVACSLMPEPRTAALWIVESLVEHFELDGVVDDGAGDPTTLALRHVAAADAALRRGRMRAAGTTVERTARGRGVGAAKILHAPDEDGLHRLVDVQRTVWDDLPPLPPDVLDDFRRQTRGS